MKRFWVALLVFITILLTHCGDGVVMPLGEDPLVEPGENATSIDAIGAAPACDLGTIGYPVMDRRAYTHVYRGRGFYTDGNHLGLDMDYPEGTPVYPIGPGIIRIYRPATGYGTLAIVVEHCARLGFEVTNGVGGLVHGQRFLTVYGHLRRTTGYNAGRSLAWQVGDRVTPYDVIGYVQRDSDNGDGAEHVHLGVRLQTMQDAITSDPTAWFRGYDSATSQRRWFADPARFYRELADQITLLDDPGAYVETPFPPPIVVHDGGTPTRDAAVSTDVILVSRDSGSSIIDASTPTIVDAGSPVMPPIDVPTSSPPPPPTSVDAGTPIVDVSIIRDTGPPDVGRREVCNGLDDDGNGLIDEIFLCSLGRQVELCPTSCGSLGYIQCEAPSCAPGIICHLFPERCTGGSDEDCDGLRDCADPDCTSDPICVIRDAGMSPVDTGVTTTPLDAGVMVPDVPVIPPIDVSLPPPPPDVPSPPPPVDAGTPIIDVPRTPADMGVSTGSVIRYEFRVLESAGWEATVPFRLRDRWWAMMRCDNTGTTLMEARSDGWYRCDLHARLSPFVGSFYSPIHSDWGDRGNLGTVGNSPDRCTPTDGVEWRITDLVSGAPIITGTSADIPCVAEGSQDRHRLP